MSGNLARRAARHVYESGSGVDSRVSSIKVARSSSQFPIAARPCVCHRPRNPPWDRSIIPFLSMRSWAGWRPAMGRSSSNGTVGGGGHAAALSRRVGSSGRVIGLDRDPAMLALAGEAVHELPVTLVHAPYRELPRVVEELGIDRVQGVLLDLGLSSDQLAWEDRGFSFVADGPLDMRFDPHSGGPTAADLLNRLSAENLANLFYEFGEERFSRRIAPGSWRRGRGARSAPPANWRTWSAEAYQVGTGMGRSTHRLASSRRFGSRSTTSSISSTPR